MAEAEHRARNMPYHKGNVDEDLRAMAKRILQRERFEDLSVRRLTREVGVTPANFYNHFKSLDDLLLDLAADAFDARRRAVARHMKQFDDRADALVAATIEFVEFAIKEKQIFRIMFGQVPSAVQHTRFRAASDASFAQLVQLVYGEDRYDPDDRVASHERCRLAYGMFALSYGLARTISENQIEFEPGDRAGIRQLVEGVVHSFIDGTAAREFTDGR